MPQIDLTDDEKPPRKRLEFPLRCCTTCGHGPWTATAGCTGSVDPNHPVRNCAGWTPKPEGA